MALPLIAAGISLGGSVLGGIMSAKKRRKQRALLRRRENEIDNTFNREYYQDFLDREQSRSFLSKLRERMKDATKVADNSAVVTGATDEAKIAKKSALQKNYAGAINSLAGMATQHKDRIMNWHQNAKASLYGQRQGMLNREAQQWTNFMNNAFSAASSFAGMTGGGAMSATPGISNAVSKGGIVSPAVSNNAFKLQGF